MSDLTVSDLQQIIDRDKSQKERILILEATFRHTFRSPELVTGEDPHREKCVSCGLNIRDALHGDQR